MIWVITSDLLLGECVVRALPDYEVRVLGDVFTAIEQIDDAAPEMIFLDLLLTGPDGFTFLNEIASYPETSKIPVVTISDLDLSRQDLQIYGVVGKLQKDTMTPKMMRDLTQKYAKTLKKS